MDRQSRERKRLYRKAKVSGDDLLWSQYHELDKSIKRTVAKWKRKQIRETQERLRKVNPGDASKIIARLDTNTTNPTTAIENRNQLVPSSFTDAQTTPTEERWAPSLVQFTVDASFEKDIVDAIRMAPKRRATGLDELFVEALQVDVDLCSKVLVETWKKCGFMKTVPKSWSTAELVPLYKKKEIRQIPQVIGPLHCYHKPERL